MECDLRRCSVADVGVDWSWEGVESCVGAMDSSSLCGYSKSLLEWLNRLGGFMWLLSLLHPLVQPEVEWLFDFDSFSTCTIHSWEVMSIHVKSRGLIHNTTNNTIP